MKHKITNKHYRQFLDHNIITIINISHIDAALNNIKGVFREAGRSLLITLYYTGCRPVEALKLKAKDFTKDGNSLVIAIPASKNGLPRTMRVSFARKHIKELWNYTRSCFKDMFVFYYFKNTYVREAKKKDGTTIYREENTDMVRYYIKKWFKGVLDEETISPYFLRHSKFSKFSQKGLSAEQIRILKGGKDIKSVFKYLHLSKDEAKKAERYND